MSSPSRRAFSSGNSASESAHALTTVASSSPRGTAPKSHSSTQVTGGTSRCARAMCSAISAPHAAQRLAAPFGRGPAGGSSDVVLGDRDRPGRFPSRPRDRRRAPRRSAARAASPAPSRPLHQPAHARSSPCVKLTPGVVAAGSGSASPGAPITTSTVPTGATSPSATRIFNTVPAYGDGISTVALSVWISTSGSSSSIS